jgi:hypothetical protein
LSYSPPIIIRIIKSRRRGWARNVARMKKMKVAYKIVGGNSEGKSLLGRPRLK